MPAVVRGGRRQGSNQAPQRGSASKGGGRSRGGAQNASAVPGKMAAIGRVDISPRTAVIALGAGALLLVGVLATGARAERIGASVSHGLDSVTAGMGLTLKRVHITGASPEAEPAIQRALGLYSGQPITSLDLNAIRTRVQGVGWVKEARVVRLLPDTLIVEVKEHDRLAVWQEAGQIKVIDNRGQVIDGADARRYPTLPLVVGKGADVAAGEILPLLAQRPRLMGMVDALVRVDERRWDLRLKDGSLIQLPATEQEAALIRLDALDQRERLLDLGFARVDLRTPDEVAVRPAGDA
ncbi:MULTISPECIES: cell division protein FtsQ/DivIB [Brevundimonas]|uniref:Cell division protein FtsQ n=1 Tax=Brevundimonas fontaquae TaxID=2813778 RepID=A0ABX7LRN8_9CAUL|nr:MULTISPECIES: cell division protein FtsQ/DivIB [Brevundimonas]KQR61175.1 cell division protein FtsQ [Brevundimonas sp. Leaf168]QSF55463.1 FtsQ-type POTRA domain-containing protein [Brevundimonas fontaquae]